MPDGRRHRPAGNLAVRDLDRVLDAVGEAAEPGAEDDRGAGHERRPRADERDRVVDHADPSATRASKRETMRLDRLGGHVGDADELEVGRRDEPFLEHAGADPVEHRRPVSGIAEHHREAADLAGLDQRQRLEQLVERAEAAGEDHEPLGGLHEHRLARVEVLERHRDVAVRIAALLVREADVEADREPARLLAAAVRRLHHPGPAARDDREPRLREQPCRLAGEPVRGRILADAGGAEDRDGGPVDQLDLLEAGVELGRDQRHVRLGRAVAAAQDPAVELSVHRRFCGTWDATMPIASAAASAIE